MNANPSFSEILCAATNSWSLRKVDESVVSIALPVHGVDPLLALPSLTKSNTFRFLWDETPGLSLAASGSCQQLDLAGPRRFELTQKFSDITLGRVVDGMPDSPDQARPKILLSFSFFENTAERQRELGLTPSVQAILPRWQLSRNGENSWLRLNGVANDEADARELAEKLWLMAEKLSQKPTQDSNVFQLPLLASSNPTEWQKIYRASLSHGLDLINSEELKKLVLAVRQSIILEAPLDPLKLLAKLRQKQSRSCRFLWQNNSQETFFGASPERLLSIKEGKLRIDALAGTASAEEGNEKLLSSEKDQREHSVVVNSIVHQLRKLDLVPTLPGKPQIANFGKLIHLHTPITANAQGYLPLRIADYLHPTPAVAGLPQKKAMNWLRALEPFERGRYAAPIGWIDNHGDSELRVAIRSGTTKGKVLELTAGAGLVKGSIAEKELKEVELKLGVLASQFEIVRFLN